MKIYSFSNLLKAYNKSRGTNFKVPSETYSAQIKISTPVNRHNIVTSAITYLNEAGVQQRKTRQTFCSIYMGWGSTRRNDFINFISEKYTVKTSELKIEIWPSANIRYAYLHTNYYSEAGQLGKSCMRSRGSQKALNFYVKNNVQIVVVVDTKKKIHARALLWSNVKKSGVKDKTYTYLDRVYGVSSKADYLFKDLAKQNDWVAYEGTSAGNYDNYWYMDNINLDDITHLPFADTFRHLYIRDKVLTSGCEPNFLEYASDNLLLTDTLEGGYRRALDPNSIREAITGSYCSKKDCTFVKRYDGYVKKENIVVINTAYYSSYDDKLFQSDLDGWIFKEDKLVEVITDKSMSRKNAIEAFIYLGFIHKTNIVKIYGKIYHKKDPQITMYNKKYYHISQCCVNYVYEDVQGKTISWFDIKDKNHIKAIKEPKFIPYKYAMSVYNLKVNKKTNEIEYQENYYDISFKNFIVLNTGECIHNSSKNKQYLKKFNGKYYIKQLFEPPNKNQLEFVFMKKR